MSNTTSEEGVSIYGAYTRFWADIQIRLKIISGIISKFKILM